MKKSVADFIIEKTRNNIIEFLRSEIGLLYVAIHKQMPDFSNYEDVVIYNYDLLTTPTIGVYMKEDENGNGNGVVTYQRLYSIKLLLDNSIVFEVENVAGDGVEDWEFDLNDVSTDELATIANAIEVTYNDIITRK